MNDLRLPALTAVHETPAANAAPEGASDAASAFDAVMARYATTAQKAQKAPAGDAPLAAEPTATSTADDGEEPAGVVALTTADAVALFAAAAHDVSSASAQAGAARANAAAIASQAADVAPSATEAGPIAPKAVARARTQPLDPQAEAAPAQAAPPQKAQAAATVPRADAPPVAAAAANRTPEVDRGAPKLETASRTEAMASPGIATASAPLAIGVSAASAPVTYSVAHAAVAAPVASSGFAPEFAQRVVLFAQRRLQQAEISVAPPELGPISVSIELRGQEATLAFTAPSQATRHAIEEALPRLREMLATQGLQLSGAEINDQPRREYARAATPARAPLAAPAAPHAAIGAVADAPRRRVGLIDVVA
jgi:flagellar hook-length control protein FliK